MKSMKNTMKCLVAVLMMAMAFAVTGITAQATEATYNPTNRTDLTTESNAVIKTYVVPSNSQIVIPINIAGKGGLDMVYAGQDDPYTYSEDLYARLCADATGITSVGYIGYFSTTEGKTVGFAGPTVAYLIVQNDSDNYDLQFSFAADFVSGADRTVKSGKNTAIFQNDGSKWVYTTYKATKTGYIAVSAAAVDNYGVYVKLTNKSKKAYSNEEYVSNGTVYYGVQKGKTYRIATKAYSDVLYNIKVKQTTVKEKSGSSKAKAPSMKKSKTYKGIQIANKKKSGTDWYKIKLTSRKALKITVNGKTSGYGDLKIKISGGSGRWTSDTGTIPQGGKTTFTTSTLSPGTYYLQVYKADKLASGYYSLSWK